MEEQLKQIESILEGWKQEVLKGNYTIGEILPKRDDSQEVKFFIAGKIKAQATVYNSKSVANVWISGGTLRICLTSEEMHQVGADLASYCDAFNEEYLDTQLKELQDKILQIKKQKLTKIIEEQLKDELSGGRSIYIKVEPTDVSHGAKSAEGIVERIFSTIPEYAEHVTGVKTNDCGRYELTFDSQDWQDKYNYALAEFCQRKQAWCDKYGCD